MNELLCSLDSQQAKKYICDGQNIIIAPWHEMSTEEWDIKKNIRRVQVARLSKLRYLY